jgi:hypothetical protein
MSTIEPKRDVGRGVELVAAIPPLASLLFAPDTIRIALTAGLFALASLTLFWLGRSRTMLYLALVGLAVTILSMMLPMRSVSRGYAENAAVRAADASSNPKPCMSPEKLREMGRALGPKSAERDIEGANTPSAAEGGAIIPCPAGHIPGH